MLDIPAECKIPNSLFKQLYLVFLIWRNRYEPSNQNVFSFLFPWLALVQFYEYEKKKQNIIITKTI